MREVWLASEGVHSPYGRALQTPSPAPELIALRVGRASAEVIRHHPSGSGLLAVRNRFEYMARAHEDFAEYVDDPAKHAIEWTYEVETYSGLRAVWPGPPEPLYLECVYVYFIANYLPSE